jgi:dihydrofolate reductase
VMGEFLATGMASGGGLVLGRRTYEDLRASWAPQGDSNPMAERINATPKFVASRTLVGPLGWNATLLEGDAGDAIAALKRSTSEPLTVLGSGQLVRTLIERRLVDRITLLIHPLVIGTGRRLLGPGTAPTTLRLVESRPTTTGVLIAVYEPA